jgi:monofunctional biosynthetic peptidoglycan transglycosylase
VPADVPARRRRGAFAWIGIALLLFVGAVGVWLGAVIASLFAYRSIDPPYTTLTAVRALTGEPVDQRWVPIDAISRRLILAVITSEDGRFCRHRGIDVREIEAALEQAMEGVSRGASTITMQLVKNLYLWPSRSYVRKAIEIPLALLTERILDKRRILEIYLNSVEWGPGVFGAEAAARAHFRTSAARLSESQAALLAVALPNPIERDPGAPSASVRRVARVIEARMRAAGPARTACVGVRPVSARKPPRS